MFISILTLYKMSELKAFADDKLLNPFSHEKIWDQTKLKAFADDNEM